jgi:AdoMet dependent proline di-methyltransferase
MSAKLRQPDFGDGIRYWDNVEATNNGVLGGFGDGVRLVFNCSGGAYAQKSCTSLYPASTRCLRGFFFSVYCPVCRVFQGHMHLRPNDTRNLQPGPSTVDQA